MPTVTINRKVLEKLLGKRLPEDELKDRISMIGTDLESIDDNEITAEIFPNRPDMLSEQGFGRALSSFLGVHTGLKLYNVKSSGEKVFVSKDMASIRPYTVCALVKKLELNDEKIKEIIQIQEKLHITFCRKRKKAAIGIYPMEKIRLPIYFEARPPKEIVFQPLEAEKKMDALKILEVHPAGKAYGHLLEGMKKFPLFRDENNEILSIPPIINSHHTGKVTGKTKEVFVEVSGFDLHTLNYVLNILMAAMADMGAEVYSMEVVYPDNTIITPDLAPKKMKADLSYLNKWLGLNLGEADLKKYLEMMGHGYEKGCALVPAYRPDIIHPVDLAEDIAIAYGYENFKAIIPSKATVGQEDSFEKFRKKISYLLSGLNMLETSSYHLSNKDIQFTKMNFDANDYVELANSKSEEHTLMRYWMLPNMMNILSINTHNEYPQNIFESGYVFRKDSKEETGVSEKCHLSAVLCSQDADYTKIRQVLDYLLRQIGAKYEINETKHDSFISGRAGKILVDGKEIGFLGEIHPQVLSNFGVEMPAAGFEIDITSLIALN